jgi:hypothetical protein
VLCGDKGQQRVEAARNRLIRLRGSFQIVSKSLHVIVGRAVPDERLDAVERDEIAQELQQQH